MKQRIVLALIVMVSMAATLAAQDDYRWNASLALGGSANGGKSVFPSRAALDRGDHRPGEPLGLLRRHRAEAPHNFGGQGPLVGEFFV